ncbi:MAG: sigma-54-dependent Fis family transcriptional regulator [Proteobacteria bacterium]|nr:sigma-54-dependent Fis family transcriptional regulator [Pseudomonadota bacterium]MCH8096266.1 sigma-54-dependent Fis family transcriptional regulator [Pseudomonadota bacterium]
MRLLIIGSLNGYIGAASKLAISRGAKVAHADDVEAALHALRSGQGADLVMVDVKLDIRGLIQSLNSERISVPVVACGLGTDSSAAASAIKAGAKEYVSLPPDPDLIAAVLQAVTEENNALVFRDPAMAEVLKLAARVAPSNASVLIVGESGSGKELVARHVHQKSKRANQKFISVNCAAIPENLLESELFGHEKGAFTGAVARRIGKFEEADGGTLLLDEISEMDPHLQAKLLRVIQEREIDRVGGKHPIKVDIRLIATSNRDLEQAIRDGTMREDLFYRLNVVNIEVPALRNRPQDIEFLAEHFTAKYADANGVPALPLSDAARQKLRSHSWRGNVRELENTMHRAVLLATGEEISADMIVLTFDANHGQGASSGAGSAGAGGGTGTNGTAGANGSPAADQSALVGLTVAEVERGLIIETLHHCLGNRTHAANILGISIRTLRNKLKQYTGEGVSVPMPGELNRAAL